MALIGKAYMAVLPSLKGFQAKAQKDLKAPMDKISKETSKSISDSLKQSVEMAKRDVQKAEKAVERAQANKVKWEGKVQDAQALTKKQTKEIELAEKDLELTRKEADAKREAAAKKLDEIKKNSKSTDEEIAKAELANSRAIQKADESVFKKEQKLKKSKEALIKINEDRAKSEFVVTKMTDKLEGANENLIAANKRLGDSEKRLASKFEHMKGKMKEVQASFKKTGTSIANFADKAKIHAGVAMGAIGGIAKKSIDYASEAEQSYGAVEAIFKDHSKTIISESKKAAKAVGLSGNEYRTLATQAGGQLKNLGFGADEVETKTKDLIKLSSDLSAMYGGTTADAANAIASLFRGEADPIEKFNVNIKQSDINARMAAKGLDKLEGKAKKQAQAQELLAMLSEQTADAQGTFNREVDTTAHKVQVSTAEMNDAKEAIGKGLLPIYSEMADAMGKVSNFAEKHPKLFHQIGLAVAGISGSILAIAGMSKVVGIISGITLPFALIGGAIAGASGALYLFFTKTEKGKEIWANFTEYVKKTAGELKDKFVGAFDRIKDAFKGAMEIFNTGDFNKRVSGLLGGADEDSAIVSFIFNIRDAVEKTGKFLGDLKTKIKDTFQGSSKALDGLKKFFGDSFIETMKSLGNTLKDLAKTLWEVIKFVGVGLYKAFKGLWPVLKPLAIIVGGVLVGAFAILAKLLQATAKVIEVLAKGIRWLAETILPPLADVVGWVADKISDLIIGIFNFGKGLVSGIVSFGGAIKDGIVAVLKFIADSIKNIWDGITGAWEWVRDNILAPIGGAIKDFFEITFLAIATSISLIWDGIVAIFHKGMDMLSPVFDAIGQAFVWIKDNVITPAVEGIKVIWQSLVDFANDYIITPISNAFSFMADVISGIVDRISAVWGALKDYLYNGYVFIRDAVIGAFKLSLEFLRDTFSAIKDAIVGVWERLKDALRAGYNFISEHVFSPFHTLLDNLKNGFMNAVDSIRGYWDSLRSALARPVNFVINKVFNDGIRPTWNKIADLAGFDDKKLAPMRTIGEFNRGGVFDSGILPGQARPGYDNLTFYNPQAGILKLSSGEAILRPELTKFLGKGFIDKMNKAARSGGTRAVQRLLGEGAGVQRHANGGYIQTPMGKAPIMHFNKGGDVNIENAINRTFRELRKEQGKPYQYAGVGNPSWDCSGLWSGITQELNIPGGFRRGRIFNTESNFANFGYSRGLHGPVTIGVHNGGGGANSHMAGTIRGIPVESAGGKGVQVGGSAWGSDNKYFEHHYTLDKFLGDFTATQNGGGGFFSMLKNKAQDIMGKFLDPIMANIPHFGGYAGQIPKAIGGKMISLIKDKILSKINVFGGTSTGANEGAPGNVESWRGLAIKTLRREGFNASSAEVNAMLRQIGSESGGNPSIAQQIVDVNGTGASAGMGLLQVIPSTFAAYRDPNLPNDRTNPEANMTAALRYFKARYGKDSITQVWGHGHGYASGGVLPGYTPNRDVYSFVSENGMRLNLGGGEAVMRQEFVDGVGKNTINYWNSLAKNDPHRLRREMGFITQRFANGGVIDIPGGHRAPNGAPISSNGGGDFGSLISAIRDLIKTLKEKFSNDSGSNSISNVADTMEEAGDKIKGSSKKIKDGLKSNTDSISKAGEDISSSSKKLISANDKNADKLGKANKKLKGAVDKVGEDTLKSAQKRIEDIKLSVDSVQNRRVLATFDSFVATANGLADTAKRATGINLKPAVDNINKARSSLIKGLNAIEEFKRGEFDRATKTALSIPEVKSFQDVMTGKAMNEAYTKLLRGTDDVTGAEEKLGKERTTGAQRIEIFSKIAQAAMNGNLASLMQSAGMWQLLAKVAIDVALDVSEAVTGALSKVAEITSKYWAEIGKMSLIVDKQREKVRDAELKFAQDTIKRVGALQALRVAENDYMRAKFEGAMDIFDAEEKLKEARQASVEFGATGVNKLNEAINRFRDIGVFSIDMISTEITERTNTIRAAEAEVNKAKMNSLFKQEEALYKVRSASLEAAKATLMQASASKQLTLEAKKLASQKAKLNGMDEFDVEGSSNAFKGDELVAKSKALRASAAAKFFRLDWIGLAEDVKKADAMEAKGKHLQELYAKEKKEALGKMKAVDRRRFEKSIEDAKISGGVAGFFGGLIGKNDAGINMASAILDSTAGVWIDNKKADLDKIDLDYRRELKAQEDDIKAKLNELELRKSKLDLEHQENVIQIKGGIETAEIAKKIAESSSKDQVKLLNSYAKEAAERREMMLSAQRSTASDVNSALRIAKAQSKEAGEKARKVTGQEVVINIPSDKTAWSNEEVKTLLSKINGSLNDTQLRIEELEKKEKATSGDYILSRT